MGHESTARAIRIAEKLPEDGRGAWDDLERIEDIFRRVVVPTPTFDVNSVQGAWFDEWTYTEGLGCFIASTQSVEINARLMLEAAGRDWPGEGASADVLVLGDKWRLEEPADVAAGKKVFFPPGANLGWIVATDNVLRAFREDPAWMLKSHPVTSDGDVRAAKLAFGASRLYPRDASGMALLRAAAGVGYTTASEMGLVAMAAGQPAVDFTVYAREWAGRYHPLYFAMRRLGLTATTLIDRVSCCPWSGIVPLDTPSDEARGRLEAYRDKTLELRARHAPLIRDAAPPPPRPAGGGE